ncbi:MAG: hypothetical protein Ct9H300mP16_01190 [Pseudomonadota bacterium]|nr:MAG: hypothetical protein Ct9H300mP16_01190 [Pseudomonadota bacterium]
MKRYPPELFSSEILQEAIAMAEEVKFASIHPLDGGRCDPVFAPFVCSRYNGSAVFLGHLVRSNPLLECCPATPLPCRLVFQAADGYISPSVTRKNRKAARSYRPGTMSPASSWAHLRKSPTRS